MSLSDRKNHLIHLLKPTSTIADDGEKIITYQKQHQCFAGFEAVKGRGDKRDYVQDQDIVRSLKRVPFDYYPDFNSTWRILDVELNQEYEVISFDSVRNIEIIAICKTVEDI